MVVNVIKNATNKWHLTAPTRLLHLDFINQIHLKTIIKTLHNINEINRKEIENLLKKWLCESINRSW